MAGVGRRRALVLGCCALLITGIRNKRDTRPFLAAFGLFVLGFAGIDISFYPLIVPPSVMIWDAAAPDSNLWAAGVIAVGTVGLVIKLGLTP